MEATDGIDAVKALGFTQLESEIYVHLLGVTAASGYAIAQAISKPAANVYKAINTLEKKGAILVDETKTRLCSAVPAEELLNALQNSFMSQKQRASQVLRSIETDPADDKVYRLKRPEQVFEKCRSLLASAEKIVLIDAFLPALEMLQAEIQATAERNVSVAVHSYGETDLPGAQIFKNPKGELTRERWQGQWINLIVDGREFVMSYLADDLSEVYQAVWSNSPYISWIYHSALLTELQLSALKNELARETDLPAIRAEVERMEQYFDMEVPGFHALQKKYNKLGDI